jgi:hypothetical protein
MFFTHTSEAVGFYRLPRRAMLLKRDAPVDARYRGGVRHCVPGHRLGERASALQDLFVARLAPQHE